MGLTRQKISKRGRDLLQRVAIEPALWLGFMESHLDLLNGPLFSLFLQPLLTSERRGNLLLGQELCLRALLVKQQGKSP
jgi:hypothetical protein